MENKWKVVGVTVLIAVAAVIVNGDTVANPERNSNVRQIISAGQFCSVSDRTSE